MQQCVTAETNIEKYVPIKKEIPVFYFNQQVFSPVYSSINNIPNNISKITIIVEYGVLDENYYDTCH